MVVAGGGNLGMMMMAGLVWYVGRGARVVMVVVAAPAAAPGAGAPRSGGQKKVHA